MMDSPIQTCLHGMGGRVRHLWLPPAYLLVVAVAEGTQKATRMSTATNRPHTPSLSLAGCRVDADRFEAAKCRSICCGILRSNTASGGDGDE